MWCLPLQQRRFYGPQERWMLISGFLRASVWSNIARNWRKGVDGNLEGEGRLLGGTFHECAVEKIFPSSSFFSHHLHCFLVVFILSTPQSSRTCYFQTRSLWGRKRITNIQISSPIFVIFGVLYLTVCFVALLKGNICRTFAHCFVLSRLKSIHILTCVVWYVFLNTSSHLCLFLLFDKF